MTFTRLQIKLAVVDALMRKRLVPRFKLATVEKAVGKKLYDGANWVMPEDAFYGMQPDVRDWFWKLPVKRTALATIRELSWGPGAPTMEHVAPNWDGESDLFDISVADAKDLPLLPNLKRFSALYDRSREKALVRAFAARGVTLKYYFD